MVLNPIRVLLIAALAVAMVGLAVCMIGGYDWSIPWEVTTYADSQEFGYRSFQKGPFSFGITGEFFTLAESFNAGKVERVLPVDFLLTSLIWVGICVLLTTFTYLSRFWFFVTQGLVIFFLMALNLQEIGFFPVDKTWITNLILILLFVVPAYFFQSFGLLDRFERRLAAFIGISAVLFLVSKPTTLEIADQVITNGYFGIVFLMLFFLILISEEIIFSILYLVTQSKGGRNNHFHFIAVSLVYLVFIGLYYARKAGFIDWEFSFFNPMLLLFISTALMLWMVKWKKEMHESYLETEHFISLLSGLGIVTFGFLSLAYFRGNDAVIDATSKFVVYAHLGFGAFLFLYVLVNLIDPLMRGFQVFKIVYKDHTLPYATARIGGLVAVAAFFFYADKAPYFFYRAGQYNYMGQQYESRGDEGLAHRFYQEGEVFGHDNHFSNYQLGFNDLMHGRTEQSNRRLKRAILRYPSAQAYLNLAGTYGALGQTSSSQAALESGLELFPGNAQIINNLSLLYFDIGEKERADQLLSGDKKDISWSDASLVNRWKVANVGSELNSLTEDYEDGNMAVKANVVSAAMRLGLNVGFEWDSTRRSFPLHRQTYLVNLTWYRPDEYLLNRLKSELEAPMDYSVRKAAAQAFVQTSVYAGFVNQAIYQLRQDEFDADRAERAEIQNQIGLIALEQHSLDMAESSFADAVDGGESSSRMNLIATLLEKKDFERALSRMSEFGENDSSFLDMKKDFQPVISGLNLNENQLGMRLYYFYDEIASEQLSLLLERQSIDLIKSLWRKVSIELLKKESFAELQHYREVFEEYLPEAEFEESDLIISIMNDGKLLPISFAEEAAGLPDSLLATTLFDNGSRNALNDVRVAAISTILDDLNPQLNYDMLVQAIDVNQTSVALHKAYCRQAARLGFVDYGRSGLVKLKELTTPTDYLEFEREFSQLVKEQENFSSTW